MARDTDWNPRRAHSRRWASRPRDHARSAAAPPQELACQPQRRNGRDPDYLPYPGCAWLSVPEPSGEAVVLADRPEHVEDAAAGDGAAGMRRVAGDRQHVAGLEAMRRAVDDELELAFEHVHHLLVMMRMPRQGRALVDVPIDEGHGGRMQEPASHAGHLFAH